MQSKNVILLDNGFQPIIYIDWQRAITMLFTGKAELVKSSSDSFIKIISGNYPKPEIIRLVKRSNINYEKNVVPFCRQNVLKRDMYCCQYCGEAFEPKDLTIDHVVPKSQGGKKTWLNVVTACKKCNQLKANRTPTQAGMKLKSVPAIPRIKISWSDIKS